MAASAAAAGVLCGAARLRYLCTSGWPERGADNGSWETFWSFLARHPPLRCFAIDTCDTIQGSAASPNAAAVDALLDLCCCRWALRLRRLPRSEDSYYFWSELLQCDGIPKGAGD